MRPDLAPHAVDRDGGAAEAVRDAVAHLCRHLHAGVPHGVFPCRVVALVSPGLIIGLGSFGGKDAPRGFEIDPRLVEACANAAEMLARFGAGIETTIPSPLVDVDGHAGADADCADSDVAIVDAPGLQLGVRIAATGEGLHAL
jgi:hypothetical protein